MHTQPTDYPLLLFTTWVMHEGGILFVFSLIKSPVLDAAVFLIFSIKMEFLRQTFWAF